MEDIQNARLTENEVKIAKLRQERSIVEIAKKLNCSGNNVFKIYKSALRKIEKYRKLGEKDRVENQLSPQQKKVLGGVNKKL